MKFKLLTIFLAMLIMAPQAPIAHGKSAQSPSAFVPPKNPYLIDGPSQSFHGDPSNSDATLIKGPSGTKRLEKDRIKAIYGGLTNFHYLSGPAYSTGEQVIWLANNNRIAKVLINDGRFEEIAHMRIPGQPYLSHRAAQNVTKRFDKARTEEELLAYLDKNFRGYFGNAIAQAGTYSLMDREGSLYTPVRNSIMVFGDEQPGMAHSRIAVRRKLTLPATIIHPTKPDAILGLQMTYDGHLVFVTIRGVVGVVDRHFQKAPQYLRFTGETITNSIAVDPQNGIYVVTDKYMRKVVWDGRKLRNDTASGAWQSRYDSDLNGTGRSRLGSGSTPTLMGFQEGEDQLVVITDGARIMNLVAFWRNDIPKEFKRQKKTRSRRIAGQIPVTFGQPAIERAQSEQSVAVWGYGAFVVNNAAPAARPDPLEQALVAGVWQEGPKGVEKFTWDARQNRWKRAWAKPDVGSPTTVPLISVGSNQVYVNGRVKGKWEITGFDWETGKRKTRLIVGGSQLFNGAYSQIQVLPGGDIVYGGVTAYLRLRTTEGDEDQS
ncbi:hypothetical protein [Brevibacillus migulae]|uniref:hypothetical protein n=1 Tax=Brevibacillus migulae TaxID=1644114 RepID=UPI00106DD722|nr:hypothetical protein [Brevibacillus migulae]